jgi:hypothetical protein
MISTSQTNRQPPTTPPPPQKKKDPLFTMAQATKKRKADAIKSHYEKELKLLLKEQTELDEDVRNNAKAIRNVKARIANTSKSKATKNNGSSSSSSHDDTIKIAIINALAHDKCVILFPAGTTTTFPRGDLHGPTMSELAHIANLSHTDEWHPPPPHAPYNPKHARTTATTGFVPDIPPFDNAEVACYAATNTFTTDPCQPNTHAQNITYTHTPLFGNFLFYAD